MTNEGTVEAPGVESSRGMSVSIGLDRFLSAMVVHEAGSDEMRRLVSLGLDRSIGRKVESVHDVLFERLSNALHRWTVNPSLRALRRDLLEILALTI
jgi:hypothetical protein